MADPITLLTIASAGASAASGIAGGMAQRSQANANAAIAERNAKEAGIQLAADEAAARNQQRALTGQQIAAVAGNGLSLEGSAMDVTMQSLVENELEIMRSRRERTLQMQGFKQEAAMQRQAGKQAMVGGVLSAFGSIAGAAGGALRPGTSSPSPSGSLWDNFKRTR